MLKIRQISKGDINSVAKMRRLLWNLHISNCNFISAAFFRKYNAYAELRKGVTKSDTYVLLADVDGVIAGYALVVLKKAEDLFKFKKHMYLDELFVAERYRKTGVGRALFKYTNRLAKRKGIPLIAKIYPFNRSMRQLFKGEGGEELYGVFIKQW